MLKTIASTAAILLTFVSYIPYIRDILIEKTKPHLYSWLLWGFVSVIVFALQLSDGAGVGAFVTLAVALMCFLVIGVSKKMGNVSKVTTSDKIFLVAALVALGSWLVSKQPLLSTILATLIGLLGFVPTIRKSWEKPYTETLSFYYLNGLRFALAVYSLGRYTLITALYPVSWLLAYCLFALLLIIRRKSVPQPTLT